MRVRFIEHGAMFRVHIGTRLEFKFERIRGKKFGSFQQLPFFRPVWDDFEILPLLLSLSLLEDRIILFGQTGVNKSWNIVSRG